ncbi:MAG: porin [Pseudodonghicola sp.]
MKKVLFATTALIATASMAAAEVRISGYGRFGLDYNEANGRTAADVNIPGGGTLGASETNITSRLRLQFDMSTETDGGVVLGARFRAQASSANNAPGTAAFNGARFYATYGGFTLGVGNIIGAVENMPGLYLETRSAGLGIDGAGFQSLVTNVNGAVSNGLALRETSNWDAYSSAGAGANGIEVLYTTGGFTGHISYSNDNGPVSVDRTAAMVSYTFGDWTAALAAQSSDIAWEDKTVVSIAGDLGQFGVRLAYADNDGIAKWGLYGNMDIGTASNILIFVTDEDAVSAADVVAGRGDNRDTAGFEGSEGTGYGIHYSYDLGGGASFEAGASQTSWDNTRVQAGVYFSF